MRLYCITGFHGSGASLAAEVARAIGADLGPAATRLSAEPDEPAGSVEHAGIRRINDRLLAQLGGSWDEPPGLEPGWERDGALDDLRQEAKETIEESFGDTALVALSDPRTSLLLPFWDDVVPISGTVLVTRDPGEVAAELAFQHQFAPERTSRLWLRYVVAAWLGSENRLHVQYRDFFEDLPAVAGRMADFLGTDRPGQAQLDDLAARFDPQQRRYDVPPSPAAPELALAYRVHDLLSADAGADVGPLFHALHEGWRAMSQAETASAEVQALTDAIEQLREDQERRFAEAGHLRALSILQGEEIKELEAVVARLSTETARLQESLEVVRSDRFADQAELNKLRKRLASARRATTEAEQRYKQLRTSATFRVASWGTSRIKRVRGVVRRVRSPSRGTRSIPGASASPVAHPSTPPDAGSEAVRAAALAGQRKVVPAVMEAQSGIDAELGRLDRLSARPQVTIVVPIFNAYEELRCCLASLERNTSVAGTELLLIDDASTDERIAAVLDEAERLEGVQVLRSEENLGFTRTVNRGFAATSGDVVILNSDCEVTPRWLQNLADGAYRNPRAATVTAISDNAGAFSVPLIGEANDRPRYLTGDEVGRLVTRTSARVYPTGPTGNGFCMYIKRAALDEVGPFDAERFPRGYGEEGDFCMRAGAAGWVNVVDDATLVFHRRSASFGEEKTELMLAGRTKLDERHPDYTAAVREFVRSDGLTQVQANVQTSYDRSRALTRRIRPRILYVHHRGTGGTPETNADLMSALLEHYEPYLLTSDTKVIELSRFDPDGPELLERWALDEHHAPEEFSNPRYRAAVAGMLTRHAIDLVHIRLLLAHSFDLPSIARALDIPVILSFHDFYLVCPTVHLLDENDRFCGGTCTPGNGACRIPSDWLKGVPHLKHEWVNVWQDGVARMIADVDAFVTTSASARTIYQQTYPELVDAPFHLIEHGRDLRAEPAGRTPDLRSPVRIAIPGALDVHKGAAFIEQLVELDTAGRLEFHFVGKVPERFQHLGVMHGPYARDQFAEKMREIKPAFVGILSIWAETYSHTLSEAWAAGVPVLVTDLGAPMERVEEHGGGWVLDHRDAEGAYARILEICDDEVEYRRVHGEVGTTGTRSRLAMARDYDRLYRSSLLARRPLRRPERPQGRVRRAALFVPGGSIGPYTGSTHVRMFRRWEHPLVRQEVAAEPLDVEDFVEGVTDLPDVAMVQRTAVPPALLDRFLETVDRGGIRLVIDLDDNLFAIEAASGSFVEYEQHLASLARLVEAADLVTVSTDRLRDAMADQARRIVVVPNMLDEFLWFGGTPDVPAVAALPGPASRPWKRRIREAVRSAPFTRRTCNLVYVGTKTHAEDLALLRPVMQRLRQRHDIDIRLLVVGGEPAVRLEDRWYGRPPRPIRLPGVMGQTRRPPVDSWYDRVEIPPGCSSYPAFVPWLRSVSPSWDIAVAPLQDTAFNRCKSDLKFLEYAALGLPGIFSDMVPYNESVRHEETGLLAENTVDAWCAAILRLADDGALRDRMAAAATDYVLRQRCLAHDSLDYPRIVFDLASSSAISVG